MKCFYCEYQVENPNVSMVSLAATCFALGIGTGQSKFLGALVGNVAMKAQYSQTPPVLVVFFQRRDP